MRKPTPAQLEAISRLFERVMDAPPERREALLATLTEDEEVRAEVRSLVEAAGDDDGFLEAPPQEVARLRASTVVRRDRLETTWAGGVPPLKPPLKAPLKHDATGPEAPGMRPGGDGDDEAPRAAAAPGANADIEHAPEARPPASAAAAPGSGAGDGLAPEDAPVDPLIRRDIAGYRIVRRIASGGMGVVYEAEQQNPRRTVALKVVRPDLLSRETLARFQREAQLLGRLQHPGIAAVFEAGSFRLPEDPPGQSRPFCAMELVDGAPITEWAAERPWSLRDLLEALARVCDAIDHAHRRGVVHRDLKAGNILMTRDGQPKVVDFGIARDVTAGAGLTVRTNVGDLVGTLGCMSPEQLRGQVDAIDARTDIYALGVLAYELLAQRPPFDLRGLTLGESLRILAHEEPTSLGALRSELRGDVAVVVAKAMEKEPSRRYPSAAAFATDLRRIVAQRPVSAKPPTRLYRMRKFVARHKVETVAAATAVALLLFAVVGTSLGWRQANAEARRAERRTAQLGQVLALLSPVPDRKGDAQLLSQLDEAAKLGADVMSAPLLASAVHAKLGEHYRALGAHEDAHRQFVLALHDLDRGGGGELERADLLESIGSQLKELDRLDEAVELQSQALDIRTRLLPPDDVRVAASHHNLAVVLRQRGDLEAALASVSRAVDLVRLNQPALAAELSWSLALKGAILADLERIDEAVVATEEADALRPSSQPDDLETATILHRLALVFARSPDSKPKAADMLTRCVQIRRSLLPADRPDLNAARQELATLLMELGEHERAATLLEESLAALRGSRERSPVAEHALLSKLLECERALGHDARAAAVEERLEELRGDS